MALCWMVKVVSSSVGVWLEFCVKGYLLPHLRYLLLKKKAKMIMSDRNHALSMCYELLPSGRRYRCLKVNPRTQKSFIPYSIRLLNSTS